jgi:nucleotide-binding universal stress UspA family protein
MNGVVIMFRKILVAYDGSKMAKLALEKAVALKRSFEGSVLEVVHVFQIGNLVVSDAVITGPALMQNELYEAAEAVVEEARTQISQVPLSTATLLDGGTPAQVILDYAETHQFDLIIIGSKGVGALQELFLGSVSQEIVHHAKIPVLVVK